MPTFRKLSEDVVENLTRRVLSRRENMNLQFYRSYVREMLAAEAGQNSALELSESDNKRVATVKRWLHRSAREEGVSISIRKRGRFLLREKVE